MTEPETGVSPRDGEVIDCRSEVGVTVGLVDTIMNSLVLLKGRSRSHPAVGEALLDLASAPELSDFLSELQLLSEVKEIKDQAAAEDRATGSASGIGPVGGTGAAPTGALEHPG